MIQLVINTCLLRELDERRLINTYARLMYNDKLDVEDDTRIKDNLIKILDWDVNGDNGLGIYCGNFESIKDRDWTRLINFLKENYLEIESLSKTFVKLRKLEHNKVVKSELAKKEEHNKKRFTDKNYKISGRGKKAKPCVYKGKEYKSRQECMYKEGLTNIQLYTYLAETGQLDSENLDWYLKQ